MFIEQIFSCLHTQCFVPLSKIYFMRFFGKVFLLSIICFGLGMQSCKREEGAYSAGMCVTQQCNNYFEVWKDYFLKVNDMSEAYFDAHIFPYTTFIESWESGESFKIRYKVKIDWLEVDVRDEFLIRIDPNEDKFPQLQLPRGQYLFDDQVAKVLDNFAFNSKVTRVAPVEQLNFSSEKNALIALQDVSGEKDLAFRRYEFKDARLNYKPNGHAFMYGIIEKENDACACGEIDLVTGEGKPYYCACVFD